MLTNQPSPQPSLWTTIRESIAGSHHGEYTEVSIDRAILLLAIPMVLELVLESVFAVVDVFFVSRLGADAVATVGLTESMLTMIYAVAIGLSLGATATVARRIGERDHDGAAIAAVQAIALGILVSVPVGLAGFWFAGRCSTLMGATPDVLAHGLVHAPRSSVLNGIVLLLFLINAVFRGAGDAAVAMRVLWIANAINICLDPCPIFGLGPFPQLGVTGAAVATLTRARDRSDGAAVFPVAPRWPHRDSPPAPSTRPGGDAEHAAGCRAARSGRRRCPTACSMFSITAGSSRRWRRRIADAAVAARQEIQLHQHADAAPGECSPPLRR